ncbi:hypothetical protein [Mameliella alba]|uniref:hypothetical protein n=2 Tax=Mameliella alba TaxID=561184 RepID=UPI000B52B9F8|nr:hypothetical protein [Mameliella alba]MBY6120566.1 hypothetical protein [Mameliella alba]OWV42883.1 hypothetical protein CDZ95_12220 [Mameliella alba]OWV63553.1 hypothetical protein CDZ97_13700 [Mameliella alba]
MRGWQIFRHSFRMVLNNLEAAFRLSAVLYAVQALNQVLVLLAAPAEGSAATVINPGMAMMVLATSILAIVASLWIAVAWHRYVLTGEEPDGAVPPWHGGLVLAYLGRSVMIALLVVVALVAALIPVTALMAMAPALGLPLMLMVVALAVYLFFRFGVMLPAGAIDRKMTLREAWAATGKDQEAMVVLTLLVTGMVVAVQLPAMLNPDPHSLINLVYSVVVGWFATMIGISVLTTLYGVCVEGRDID